MSIFFLACLFFFAAGSALTLFLAEVCAFLNEKKELRSEISYKYLFYAAAYICAGAWLLNQ